mmetsp:Transcript_72902/g.147543  ORF Transcript_72902/g.147543 Transcript_72902/m.147543 type:complete len:294 (+) Transcript_72902:490-1371(+)
MKSHRWETVNALGLTLSVIFSRFPALAKALLFLPLHVVSTGVFFIPHPLRIFPDRLQVLAMHTILREIVHQPAPTIAVHGLHILTITPGGAKSCIFLLRTEAKGCRFLVPGLRIRAALDKVQEPIFVAMLQDFLAELVLLAVIVLDGWKGLDSLSLTGLEVFALLPVAGVTLLLLPYELCVMIGGLPILFGSLPNRLQRLAVWTVLGVELHHALHILRLKLLGRQHRGAGGGICLGCCLLVQWPMVLQPICHRLPRRADAAGQQDEGTGDIHVWQVVKQLTVHHADRPTIGRC